MKNGFRRLLSVLLCLVLLTGTAAVGGEGLASLRGSVSITANAVDQIDNKAFLKKVKAEKASVNSRQVTYEIHLEDNGEQIQPDVPVLVRLPIPEGFDESKINVYRTEPDGSKTRLNFIIDSGCV